MSDSYLLHLLAWPHESVLPAFGLSARVSTAGWQRRSTRRLIVVTRGGCQQEDLGRECRGVTLLPGTRCDGVGRNLARDQRGRLRPSQYQTPPPSSR